MGAQVFGIGAHISRVVQFGGVHIGKGDVVFVGAGAAIVEACVRDQSEALWLLARLLVRTARGHAWSEWRLAGGELAAIPLSGGRGVVVAYAWAYKAGGGVLALHAF